MVQSYMTFTNGFHTIIKAVFKQLSAMIFVRYI